MGSKAYCQDTYVVQLSYDYQIVILSCYIQLFCKIAVDIFICYNKNCYCLSLLVQTSIVMFVSPYGLVSFIMIVLFCQILQFYALSKGMYSEQSLFSLNLLIPTYATTTVQLRYIRTTHTRIIRSYFAYTHMSIHVYAYVNTCVYVPLLCIPISFFM